MRDGGNNSGQVVLQRDIRHHVGQVVASVRPVRNTAHTYSNSCLHRRSVVFPEIETPHDSTPKPPVPGDGANGELGGRLGLMHEQLKVD